VAKKKTESSFPYTVIGNWKMHKTLPEVKTFLEEIAPNLQDLKGRFGLAVPFTAIKFAADICKQDPRLQSLIIGAQNMSDATSGAFTGEIAGKMLVDAGAQFVLLGHSERRTIFHESDDFINSKVLKAIQDKIPFILCIGETFDEHKEGKSKEILQRQLKEALKGVSSESSSLCTIAYEPVWAIGSGLTPKVEDIEAACALIQDDLEEVGITSPILYGGSVSSKNANDFAKIALLNGFLVGGASLQPAELVKIFGAKSS